MWKFGVYWLSIFTLAWVVFVPVHTEGDGGIMFSGCPSVCVCRYIQWTGYLINCLGELHQIYHFALYDKDELVTFWGQLRRFKFFNNTTIASIIFRLEHPSDIPLFYFWFTCTSNVGVTMVIFSYFIKLSSNGLIIIKRKTTLCHSSADPSQKIKPTNPYSADNKSHISELFYHKNTQYYLLLL